jgi:drug/metabolite transporter (DMT)-like permease
MIFQRRGIQAALASAFLMGLLPVLGKQAILQGMPPLAVVALRTILAAIILLFVMFFFQREYLYIYPLGFLGCLLAGGINGTGSLLYYSALGRIDAGLGQLLYSLYPLFTILWFRLDRQPPSRLTVLRFFLAVPAVFLLIQTRNHSLDLVGVLMMLGAALLYGLHLPINQRVLYDMPAPTVTLYTLFAMSAIVVPFYLVVGPLPSIRPANSWFQILSEQALWSVVGLSLVTFLSRLTLFVGVKNIGGIQTALLGLGELIVTILFAQLWLGERLSKLQWIGATILVFCLVLIFFEKPGLQKNKTEGWLSWLKSPNLPENLVNPPRQK